MKRLLLAILISFASTCLLASQAISEITSSRHNLMTPWSAMALINVFNRYGEVCVYCHTPHGGQSSNAPLWNRTMPTGSYTPYSSSTIDTNVGQPDGVSLACLSCHDGTIAVDSIVNAPGSGTAWGGTVSPNHYALAQIGQSTTGNGTCLQCHRPVSEGGILSDSMSFTAMALTQNLSNQHPISMNYPTAVQDPGFNTPTITTAGVWFEEAGGIAGRADDNEIKLYSDGAGGYKVQCASCHNPHGTEAAIGTPPNQLGRNGVDYATFLRKSNSSSALCTTCHIK